MRVFEVTAGDESVVGVAERLAEASRIATDYLNSLSPSTYGRCSITLGPLELVGELRHDQAPWGGKIIVWHPSVNLANIQGEQDAVVSGH